MNHSENLSNLAAAFAAFQSQVEAASKNATNPHLRNKYADLASIWDTIRDPLTNNGLSVAQLPMPGEDGRLHLQTRLLHTSGEWLAGTIVMPLGKQDPQGYGSALTYARRYGLAAMLGIIQEDDDGDRAVRGAKAEATPKATAKAPAKAPKVNADQLAAIRDQMKRVGWSKDDALNYVKKKFNKGASSELTDAEADQMIEFLATLEPADPLEAAVRGATPPEFEFEDGPVTL